MRERKCISRFILIFLSVENHKDIIESLSIIINFFQFILLMKWWQDFSVISNKKKDDT